MRQQASPLSPDFTLVTVEVTCADANDVATGGGFSFEPNASWEVSTSRPNTTGMPNRWIVRALHREDGPQIITAYVVCARVD